VTGLSAGEYHTCARLASGAVWCWGTLTGYRAQPLRRIEGIANAGQITSGADHACARLKNGDVVCFGEMGYGEQFLSSEKPKKIAGLHGATGLRSGTHVTCGVRAGAALCWGENGEGQLGDGTRLERAEPVRVRLPGRAAGLAVGFRHACAVDAEGAVWCWGTNTHGQLGDGRVSWCARPSEVALPDP
jgi:alpha-tubulin suppressor-like RCC1 family protein